MIPSHATAGRPQFGQFEKIIADTAAAKLVQFPKLAELKDMN